MLIQFASDLHLEIPKNNRYFQQEKITPFADILILAGDTMYWDEDYLQNPFGIQFLLLLHKFLSFREIMSFIKDLIWLLYRKVHQEQSGIMCIGTIINLLCLMEFKLFFQHYGHTFLLP